MAFLHGVETIQINTGLTPITQVRTAVIGLVGTASKWTCADTALFAATQKPVLVSSLAQAIQYFGTEGKDSYTIPAALKQIFEQGPAICVVVNVLDPTTNNANITDEAVTLNATTDTVALAHAGVTAVVVKHTSGSPTYVVGTDYTVDAVTGVITRVRTGAITAGQSLKVSYSYTSPAAITATDIAGTIVSGNRTGAQALLDAGNFLGIVPKILIAPGYASSSTTIGAFDTIAAALRAVWIGDVASGTTVANALLTRGSGGIFNTSSMRGIACYPYLKDSEGTLRPMSGFVAGAIAAQDNTNGYWWSPSNKELKGVSALERSVSFALNDPTSDANTLNGAGIMTCVSAWATGLRAWGNRNLSYPSSTLPQNFVSVLRTQDVIWESVENATLMFLDRPIGQALVDSIKESVNAFLRTLQARGAILDGECTFDPTLNPPTEIANGHLTFTLTWTPSFPCERVTFNSTVDLTALKSLR